MKRFRIRSQSSKARRRASQVASPRESYVRQFGFCWVCRHRPRVIVYPPITSKDLACHEILRGTAHRQKALDEFCQIVVACGECNCGPLHDRKLWPDAKQLALVQHYAPNKYDLKRFNKLRSEAAPQYVEQSEVDGWSWVFEQPPI